MCCLHSVPLAVTPIVFSAYLLQGGVWVQQTPSTDVSDMKSMSNIWITVICWVIFF